MSEYPHYPPQCPLNDGANCPHRRTENLVHVVLVVLLLNIVVLSVMLAWLTSDRFHRSDAVAWCKAMETENPTIQFKCPL